MRKLIALTFSILALSSSLFAKKEPGDSTQILMEKLDSIQAALPFQTGKIELSGGIATINVPSDFKYYAPKEAKFVIEELWGNPPSGYMPLGLLVPASMSLTNDNSYAYVIQFDNIGYVKDGDADTYNYDDILKDMKASIKEENEEKIKMGIPTVELVGWAAKPYYDKEKRVLHWAKELSFQGEESNILNYDIRVLGRKGVLILKAVSVIDQLDSVNAHINEVLGMVSFNDGHRYTDFDSKTDDIAAWGIGGLVAGKVLAKVGFFGVILKFLKFILIGLALVGGAVWRFITGRKKKEEEFVYEPQPAPSNNPENTPPA